MKILVLLVSLFLGSAALANTSQEALDSAMVDALIDTFNIPLTPGEYALLPKSFFCDGIEFNYPQILNDSFTSVNKNQGGEAILFNLSEGDQMQGVLVVTKDIQALAAGTVTEIPAKLFNGFWFADGSHYGAGDATCVTTPPSDN